MNSGGSNNVNLNYERYGSSGWWDLDIIKLAFVAKTQFHKGFLIFIWPIVKQYIANRPKVYSADFLFRRLYFRVFSRQDFLLANFRGLFTKSVFPRNYSVVTDTTHFSHSAIHVRSTRTCKSQLYMYGQLELVNPGYTCTVN